MQWARKEKVDSRALDEWECRVVEAIQTRIDRLRKNKKNPSSVRQRMPRIPRRFSNTFVLVPADKASNNVLIVCKKYYLDVVLKELDMSNGTNPQTHMPCSDHVENIIVEHQNFMTRQNIKNPSRYEAATTFLLASKNAQKSNRQ